MGNFYIIPVSMIKSLFVNTNAYYVLSNVGCYISAMKSSNYEDKDVLSQLAYCYFRRKDELTPGLIKAIEDFYNDGEMEDDDGLFCCGSMNEEEIYFLEGENEEEPVTPLGLLADACRKDRAIWDLAKEWHDV